MWAAGVVHAKRDHVEFVGFDDHPLVRTADPTSRKRRSRIHGDATPNRAMQPSPSA